MQKHTHEARKNTHWHFTAQTLFAVSSVSHIILWQMGVETLRHNVEIEESKYKMGEKVVCVVDREKEPHTERQRDGSKNSDTILCILICHALVVPAVFFLSVCTVTVQSSIPSQQASLRFYLQRSCFNAFVHHLCCENISFPQRVREIKRRRVNNTGRQWRNSSLSDFANIQHWSWEWTETSHSCCLFPSLFSISIKASFVVILSNFRDILVCKK